MSAHISHLPPRLVAAFSGPEVLAVEVIEATDDVTHTMSASLENGFLTVRDDMDEADEPLPVADVLFLAASNHAERARLVRFFRAIADGLEAVQ